MRWTVVALIGTWLAYVVLLVLWGPGLVTLRDSVLYVAVSVLAAGLVIARVVLVTRERPAWTVLAVGLVLSLGAMAVYGLAVAPLDPEPFPSVADGLFLTVYLAWYGAVALLVRNRLRDVPRSVWLDGAVAVLAGGALLGAWFLAPIRSALTGSLLSVMVSTAYPVADVLLLLLAIFGLVVLGSRAPRTLWWFAAAMVTAGTADLAYWQSLSAGGPVRGTWFSALWPASRVMLAVAAWVPVPERARRRPAIAMLLVAPAVSLVVSVGVLVRASEHEVPVAAVAMAATALLGVLLRLAMTVAETGRMMDAHRIAATDELTDLPNRRGFGAGAARVIAASTPENPGALLMLDLDGFKEVNDSLGHHAGDRLLADLADRIRDTLRSPDDVLGRLGGDEFALMLPGVTPAEADQVALRLAAALRTRFIIDGVSVQSAASIGIALVPEHGSELSLLLRRADIAMYRAKVDHLGHTTYDAERDQVGEDRLHRVAEVRQAVEGGELVLHYQPKVALPEGTVVAVEALVRWDRPGHGLVFPDDFLPLVEDAGLMPALTAVVLEAAVTQAAAWRAEGIPLPVAVNLPSAAVVDEALPERVADLLARHSLPAALLQIEITEEALLRDRTRAQAVLARLRLMGIRISIDDYGSGYSSLAYLRELTVDEIKLDKSFVFPMADDARAASIVRSTIDLAHALGLGIVAEGVEHLVAAQELSSYGCDTAQGYFWTRPLPAHRLREWIDARSDQDHDLDRVDLLGGALDPSAARADP